MITMIGLDERLTDLERQVNKLIEGFKMQVDTQKEMLGLVTLINEERKNK